MIQAKDMQVFEILNEISKIKNDELKIEILRDKYSDHTPLLRVLKWNFCDTVVTVLPEGTPPFNREKIDGPSKSSLWGYIKMFPYFVQSGLSSKMKMLQIEKIFIEMLEAIDVEEADLVCLTKDKALTTKWNISSDVIKTAFPQLKITNKIPPKEKTGEERAEELIELAAAKKEQAKLLQEQAKAMIAEAKSLAGAA